MSNTILILTWTIRQMWAKVHIKVKTETVNIRTEHTEKKIDSNEDMNGWLSYSFCGFEIKFLIFIRFHAFCERITRLCSALSINISTVNDKKGLHFNAWMGKLDDWIEWLEWNSPVDQFPPRDINGFSFLYGFFFVSFRCHRMYLYRSRNFNRKPSVWNRKFLERLGDWISGCRTKHQRAKHKQHA